MFGWIILLDKSSVRMRVKDTRKTVAGQTEVTYHANWVITVAALKFLSLLWWRA